MKRNSPELDKEELQILADFERGEFNSVRNGCEPAYRRHAGRRFGGRQAMTHSRVHSKSLLAISMMMAVAMSPVDSSQLRDFEHASTRPNRRAETRESGVFDEIMGELFASCFSFIFITLFIEPITTLSSSSMARVDSGFVPIDDEKDVSRSIGDPDLPFFRIDLHYQRVSSNLDGLDGRLEAGYGALAAQVRHTRYEERKPSEKLNFTSIHGLLRLSEDNRFETGLGFGALFLDGDRLSSGFSMTSPINWYPHRHIAVRAVPTLSWLGGSTIGDYDISLGYTRPYFSVQSGYRWLRSGGVSIHGPYVGFSLYY